MVGAVKRFASTLATASPSKSSSAPDLRGFTTDYSTSGVAGRKRKRPLDGSSIGTITESEEDEAADSVDEFGRLVEDDEDDQVPARRTRSATQQRLEVDQASESSQPGEAIYVP